MMSLFMSSFLIFTAASLRSQSSIRTLFLSRPCRSHSWGQEAAPFVGLICETVLYAHVALDLHLLFPSLCGFGLVICLTDRQSMSTVTCC